MGSIALRSLYLEWLAGAIGSGGCPPSSVPTGEQDFILGYATGYDVADVAIFVRSVRAHFKGAVALVVDNDPELRAFLNSHDIEALDDPAKGSGGRWTPHPVVSRFAGAQTLLLARPWVRNALLTDVRDVVFQGDPFAQLVERLELFAETDKPLAQHAFNMKYLRAVAGEAVTRLITDKACICVGTVVGPREDLIRFCRVNLMVGAIPRSEIGGTFGTDQAACNVAAHLGLIDCDVLPNHSRIATLGMVARDQLAVVDGKIANPDGSFSPVVHQYDRHDDLMARMWEQWASDQERRDRKQPRDWRSQYRRVVNSIRKRRRERR